MKKNYLLLFFFLINIISLFGQDKQQLVITPGVGIDKLKLGMNEDEVSELLKGDLAWMGYKEEMCTFAGQVEEVDTVVQFVLGFDSCAKYHSDLSTVIPVYSLYFKNHRLIYITVTTYGANEELIKQVVMTNGIRFYDDMQTCMNKFGKNFLPITWEDYDGDHIYFSNGMEVTYDQGKLTVVGIFPPTENFRQVMAARSILLRMEFAACKKAQEE